MGTVTILRLEDKDGYGPFNRNGRGSINAMNRAMTGSSYNEYHNSARFPTPREEGMHSRLPLERTVADYRAGASSVGQLRSWFPKRARAALTEFGFTVAKYAVPEDDVITGRRQVLFLPDHAKLIDRVPVADWR